MSISRVNQNEISLQSLIMWGLKHQGVRVAKTTEKYIRGRPDLRIGRRDLGQMDVELKYLLTVEEALKKTGLKKVQKITIDEMNAHGMPAVGLLYVESEQTFFICNLLRADLTDWPWRVRRKSPIVLPIEELFSISRGYLNVEYRRDA